MARQGGGNMSPCPGREQLVRLLAEQVDAQERALLEVHVESCAACQLVLGQLADQASPNPASSQASDRGTCWPTIRPGVLTHLKHKVPDLPTTPEASLDDPAAGQAKAVAPANAAAPEPNVPGYQILAELGHGGMGIVYKARQLALDRVVALKMLRVERTAPDALTRFQREAQAVAQLQHPNIVQIYEIGAHQGRPYISLEYVPDGSLAMRLGGTPLPAHRAAQLTEELARAVEYAHAHGIVHRDLKPGNILLAGTGDTSVPKITDFGLARRLDQATKLTQSGDILGTPSYMAPEQAMGGGQHAGSAVDIYGLGAILYEMLSGRPPFQAETPLETLYQVQTEEPVPPIRLQPKLPRDLQTICLKCLEKDPSRRYASAQALADDLRRFRLHEPIHARPTPVWQQALRWARRRPAAAGLVAVTALAVLALSLGSLWYSAQLRTAVHTAEERGAEAQAERARAIASLYHSLLGEAQALRFARVNGYRRQAWDRLQQALSLNTPERDPERLRQEAVACLGDFVGLDPTVVEFPQAGLETIALHPDGNQLAVGLHDGGLLLRDLSRGVNVQLPREHWSPVDALVFAANGRRLVSHDRSGHIKVWEPTAGAWKVTRTLAADAPLVDWDLHLTYLALSPDGNHLAACSAGATMARLWDLGDSRPVACLRMPPQSRLHCLAMSPSGEFLATGHDAPGGSGVLIWDTAQGQLRTSALPSQDYPRQVVFSPDGRWLASACGDGGIVLCDTADFQRRLFVRGDNPVGVAFSPDSQLLAITSAQVAVIRLWHVASNREVAVLKHPGTPHSVLFSPDGKALLAADARSVHIWNLAGSGEKRVLAGHAGGVPAVVFSPDGRLLASAGKDHTVRIWDPATGEVIQTLTAFRGSVQTVAFSKDGRLLATGDWARCVRIWEVGTWHQLAEAAPSVGLQTWKVAFSPDGQFFAACGEGGGVVLWRIARGDGHAEGGMRLALEKPQRLSDQGTVDICFSPDSRRLAWVELPDRQIRLWDIPHGRGLTAPRVRLKDGIHGLAFLPDSRRLAWIGPAGDPEVWDADSAQMAFSCEGPGANGNEGRRVNGIMALSPDGSYLAQEGPRVRLWDLEHRKLLLILPDERSLPWSFAWSPNNERLAVGSSDGGLVIWDLPTIRSQLGKIGLSW
jgi:WD40 repeat protein/tRNA A-37 threonylcarbamoyl transferase component Bud32